VNTGWDRACAAVLWPVLPVFSRGSARHVSGAAATQGVLEVFAVRCTLAVAARWPCEPFSLAGTTPGVRWRPGTPLAGYLRSAPEENAQGHPAHRQLMGPARGEKARQTGKLRCRQELCASCLRRATAGRDSPVARAGPGQRPSLPCRVSFCRFSAAACPRAGKEKGPRMEALCGVGRPCARRVGSRRGLRAQAPGVFFQSARKAARPLSVSGWLASFSRTLKGMVATSAPSSALCRMCMGLRTLATRVWVEKP